MRALIVGQGELGWRTLQILALRDSFETLIAWDVNPHTQGRTSVVAHGNDLLGVVKPQVQFEQVDIFETEDVVDRLEQVRPDVIVNTASMQSWWVITQLPPDVWKRLHATGLGVWLPAHLAPAYSLMQAVSLSKLAVPVVNMAFPDATNVALARVGLAPSLGGGNVEELVPPLRSAIASDLGVSKQDIRIWLFAHHWVNAAILEERYSDPVPMICRVFVGQEDATDRLDIQNLLLEGTKDFPPGAEDTWLIAASAAHKAEALVKEQPALAHAAGPVGLPGGYPVVISRGTVGIDLPPGVSLEQCIKANEEGALRDGIERITESGEVILRQESVAITKDLLGWNLESFKVQEALPLARELVDRYRSFAAKFN